MGGRTTKDNNLGIFSPLYDRGTQSKQNWENGCFAHINFSERCSVAGKRTRETNSGIFREDLQHLRSEWARIGANSLTQETRGGYCSKTWMRDNTEAHFKNSSAGGKLGGAIVGRMFWWTNGSLNKRSYLSPGDEWVRGMTKNTNVKGEK